MQACTLRGKERMAGVCAVGGVGGVGGVESPAEGASGRGGGRAVLTLRVVRPPAWCLIPLQRGRTTLHWAAREGHVEVVKALLEFGADVHALEKDGYSALSAAARFGHAEVVEVLVVGREGGGVRENRQ